MAHLTDLDLTAPADSLYSGGTVLNTWRTRIDVLNDALGDITSVEADQIEAIGTSTISAAQWVYLGALDQSIITTASVDFGEVDITKTTTLAAGGFGLRSQVTHSTTGMTGTLRGAYIVATNAPFTATGVIRGAEIKARAATSGDVGGNVTTLEGVSISSDAKNKTVTTQRGMEVILDGKSGAAVTLGVGIRIANNYQANIATTSYALQIYRDSFDYTADIHLSGGGLIGGSTGKIKMDASGVTTLTASGNLDIGSYNFRANTLTADGLTATRVIFAGASGLLSDAAAMTFVTDTLTVTKLGAFQAAGAINFDSQNMTNVDIDSGTINGITDLAVVDGGTGSSTAADARTALGLVIGTNVLAYDAGLSNLAGIAMAADKFYYTSADNTHVAGTVTAFARTILDDADAATQLGTLGLSTNLPNLVDAEVTQLEAIGSATISAGQWGYLGACTAGGGQLLAALTEAESTQVEAIGATTISVAQWGYLGGMDQAVAAASAVAFDTINLTGGQIAFPATAAPSAGANTLDDYEEGTWTMGVSFGGGTTDITYSANTGYYTKIGNVVTISGYILLTSKGTSTGDVLVTGLPFTVVNNVAGDTVSAMRLQNISFANQYIGYTVKNTTTIQLVEVTEAGAVTTLTDVNFANNSIMQISCTYRVE